MVYDYKYNTFRKEGDFVVFPYEQIKFNLKHHVLPYYIKNISAYYVIEKELDSFFDEFSGIVRKSSLREAGGSCKYMIEFKFGGIYHFDKDTYLNKCNLVRSEDEAKSILYFLMEQAIEELQLSTFKKIELAFLKIFNDRDE